MSSLNDQLNVLQTELSSLALEREELNERLSNSAPPQVRLNLMEFVCVCVLWVTVTAFKFQTFVVVLAPCTREV